MKSLWRSEELMQFQLLVQAFSRTVGDPATGLIHMLPIGAAMYYRTSSYDEAIS